MSSFNIGGTVNSAADWLCNAPVIRGIVNNPIFTALLITALISIVVMSLYHYQIKRLGIKRGVRAILYTFFIVTAVTFVHHYAVVNITRERYQQKGVLDIHSSIRHSQISGSSVPVYPMVYGRGADPISGGDDPIADSDKGLLNITDVVVPVRNLNRPFGN